MQINIFQIILITAYSFWTIVDSLSWNFALSKPVVSGMVVGLILGDPITGLIIGGTLQLLILGVGTYGGASIPDYNTSAMIATVVVVAGGLDRDIGLTMAVPLGLLLVQLDILARFTNSYFMHKADAYAEKSNLDGICRVNILGMIPWGLSRALPVLVFLLVGDKIVAPLNEYVQNAQWLTAAFRAAAGLLPAIGFAILLRYVNTKKHFPYLILGFVLAAYLNVPILGIALMGLAAAFIVYKQQIDKTSAAVAVGGGNEDE